MMFMGVILQFQVSLHISAEYILPMVPENSKFSANFTKNRVFHEDWLDEVDRVANNLKVVARLESKDWRARLDQISSHQKSVEKALSTTKPRLDRLEKDLTNNIFSTLITFK